MFDVCLVFLADLEKGRALSDYHHAHIRRTMVKIDLPMSFDIDVLEHDRIWEELAQSGELGHVMDAVKWDTDYLIKAHAQSHVLYGKEEMVIQTIITLDRTSPAILLARLMKLPSCFIAKI
ncbi:endoglucanase 6-like protein, partial [Tanacetum coccineum]